jgi:hypothetical protein
MQKKILQALLCFSRHLTHGLSAAIEENLRQRKNAVFGGKFKSNPTFNINRIRFVSISISRETDAERQMSGAVCDPTE